MLLNIGQNVVRSLFLDGGPNVLPAKGLERRLAQAQSVTGLCPFFLEDDAILLTGC